MSLSIDRSVRALLLLAAFFAAGVSSFAHTNAAAPQIDTVAVVDGEITITGKNFGTERPAVTLGDATLTIVRNSDTEIVAAVQVLDPGIYELRVTPHGAVNPDDTVQSTVLIR